jgi:RNA polymerase sigma-70 factor (ECF subfamily)
MRRATTATERQAALAALYDRDGAGVYRFLSAQTGDPERARELCQETFLRLAGTLAAGDLPGEALAFRIARNLLVSDWRRRRTEARWRDPAPAAAAEGASREPLPDRAFEQVELRGALAAALAELPEGLRSVVLLTEVEGLAYRTVAAALEIPPGTVASRKHEAIARLRERLRRSGHAL